MGAAGAAVGLGLQAVGTAGSLFGGGGGGGGYASGITKREVELITHKWEKYDKRLLENEARIRQAVLDQSIGEGSFAEAMFTKEEAQLQAIRDAALSDLDYQVAQAEDQIQKRVLGMLNQQAINMELTGLSMDDLSTQMELTMQRREFLQNQVDFLLGDIHQQGIIDEFNIARQAGEREMALDRAGFQQRYEVGDVKRRVQDVAFTGEYQRELAEANVDAATQGREFVTAHAAGAASAAVTSAKAARDIGITQAEASRTSRLNQLINDWYGTEEDAARIQMALGTRSLSSGAQVQRMLDRANFVTGRSVEDARLQSALAAEAGELGVAQAGVRAADIRGQADISSLDALIGAQRGLVDATAQEDIGNVKAGRQLTEARGLLAMGENERENLRSLGRIGDQFASESGRLSRESQRGQILNQEQEQLASLSAQRAGQFNDMERLKFGLSPLANYGQDAAIRDLQMSGQLTDMYAPYIRDEIERNYQRNLHASQVARNASAGSYDIRSQLNALNSRAELNQAQTNLASQLLQGQLGGGGGGGGASLTSIARSLGGLAKGAMSLFSQPSSSTSGVSPILASYGNLIPGFSGQTAQLPSFSPGASPGFTGQSAPLPAFQQGNVVNPSLFTQAPASAFSIDNSVQFQGFGNF